MEQRVSLIALGVQDVARATKFYEDLGWQPSKTASNEHITFFQLGCTTLGLYSLASLSDESGQPLPSDGFGGVTLAYNTRSKEEVDQVLKEAESAGGRIAKPGADAFWGGYVGYFTDLDGHVWEVTWNPFFTIEDNGAIHLPE